jgi:hypothetical protein
MAALDIPEAIKATGFGLAPPAKGHDNNNNNNNNILTT